MQLKIVDERIKDYLPKYATIGSAAFDLCACISSDLTLNPGDKKTISAGFALYIQDPELAGLILPRSGLGSRHGIILANGTGLIDSDYQGLIQMVLVNVQNAPYTIRPMERVAQMMIIPCKQIKVTVVDSFVETERGAGGFGSTGNK